MSFINVSATDTSPTPLLSQVGGKALSLIQSIRRGHRVPATVILPVSFFQPWVDAVQSSPAWTAFATAKGAEQVAASSAVKEGCSELTFSAEQQQDVAGVRGFLQENSISLAAVRSSSPEEDREETSFAGIYDSVMGVTPSGLETAIRTCFASLFDPRVVAYKQQIKANPLVPRIAVVVQQQLLADLSGVAFSLNPVNNSYDQCVVNANYGLGQTVVDGTVTPDQWVVEKVKAQVLESTPGDKRTAEFVGTEGGTESRTPTSASDLCLSNEQVLEVMTLTSQVESEYGKPMDIEWAYQADLLYLLQARPVTTYYRLPDLMITKPGEQKHLYQDNLLTEQGLTANMSPLGLDIMREQTLDFVPGTRMDDFMTFERGMAFLSAGRAYANFGRMVKAVGKKNSIKPIRLVDNLGAQILESMDLTEYIPRRLPKGFMTGLVKGGLGAMAYVGPVMKATRDPETFLRDTLAASDQVRLELKSIAEREDSFANALARTNRQTSDLMNRWLLPALFVAETARKNLKKLFKSDPEPIQNHLRNLEKSFVGNVTIEMGLALHELAQTPEVRDAESPELCLEKLNRDEMSTEFREKWNRFMETYGFRGPRELDIATPRYYEKPLEVLTLLKTMGDQADPESTPGAVFDRGARERQESLRFLEEYLTSHRRRQLKTFRKLYQRLENLAALRESPKYYWILGVDYLRRRVLAIGETLTSQGRLDSPEQAFQLTVRDFVRGESEIDLDVRSIAIRNQEYNRRFNRSENPPVLIDSRGYIPTLPPGPMKDNQLEGTPVSSGAVEGPVKVLSRPNENPILPGDILVTRATDPGWTTLFINAAGVLLECGGTLQHGASVAREMGKPCIVGIPKVTEILKDGDRVRFDGAVGVVSVLE